MNPFDIVELPGKGYSMIALKDFAPGDIIIEEEPFVAAQFSWNATYGYKACDHCMRPLESVTENVRRLASNPLIEVPHLECDPTADWRKQFRNCPNCGVTYCSEDCLRLAFRDYHQSACMGAARFDESHPINVLNETWKLTHFPPETGTIMLIVRLMAKYHQSTDKTKFLQDLQSFQSRTGDMEQAIYHKMLGANFQQQMTDLFTAFCNAFPGEEFALFNNAEGFKSLMAIMGTNGQGFATSPFAEWVKRATKLELNEFEKASLNNCIDELYSKIDEFAGEFLNCEGTALYLLESKINHSCAPNAEASFPYSNDIVSVRAIEPIQQNQEICISYMDDCQLLRSRHSRQKYLKENYIFLCSCTKCTAEANDPDETSEDEDEDMDDDDQGDHDDDQDDDEM